MCEEACCGHLTPLAHPMFQRLQPLLNRHAPMDVNCDRTPGRRIGLETLSNLALIVHLLLKGVTLA